MVLPNLELVEYKAKEIFLREKKRHVDLVSIVFPQTWGSTALGFDKEGDMTIFGGQAMTEAYTVVVHDRAADEYVVFFGNTPAYHVYNPTEEFFADIKKMNMASVSEARERY